MPARDGDLTSGPWRGDVVPVQLEQQMYNRYPSSAVREIPYDRSLMTKEMLN
jgi:hypothetical protein